MDGTGKSAVASPTMNSLESQASDLTSALQTIEQRVESIYGAINGDRPHADQGEDEGRAAGCIAEITRRLNLSRGIVEQISKTLTEIESVVLSEKAVAAKA